jgi:hypothetical protein
MAKGILAHFHSSSNARQEGMDRIAAVVFGNAAYYNIRRLLLLWRW